MRPLRLFYLPNEYVEGDQVGPRRAFESMLRSGELSAYAAHSYLVERRRHSRHDEALRSLFDAVDAFRPDVVFWQHLTDAYPLTPADLARIKQVGGRPMIVYHEADVYGRRVKRMDRTLKTMFGICDVAVLVGLGEMARLAREAGARRILLSPHSFDEERFGKPWDPPPSRRFDAVMIANLHCLRRIPWLHMPGGADRKRTARLFHAAYGERFAVHGTGQGWKGEPYCLGPLPFEQQEQAIHEAWISVNWGQFDDVPMYASDRLAISLAAGVPHITNHQAGYEWMFPRAKGLYAVNSPAEALDVADMLLSLPRERRIEIGWEAHAYAREHLRADKVYGDLVRTVGEHLQRQADT